MECILPSEAARLVLGFLFNQEQCLSIARDFLESCVHLAECRKLAKSNRFIQTEIHGYSLEELLDEFCVLYTLIIEAAELRNIELSPAAKLSEKLKILLTDHNESTASCEGSSRKRKRGKIAFPVSGHDISQERLFLPEVINLDVSQNSEARLSKESPSKPTASEQRLSTLKQRGPGSAVKRKSSSGTTPSKSRTDFEVSDDSMMDFSEIFSRALDNKELHESLASCINKALNESGTLQDAGADRELDSVVRDAVNDSQRDPCFERFLDDIITGPVEDGQGTSPPSPQPPPLGQARRSARGHGIKTRLRSAMTYDDIVQLATLESPAKQESQTQEAPATALPPGLSATVSYTVPVTIPGQSRVTVLPSLDTGGRPATLAEISAIQSVFIGGLADFNATAPGMPPAPVAKRWKMDADGYVNILPKPKERAQPRSSRKSPQALPPVERRRHRKNSSPRIRKSTSKRKPKKSTPKPKTPAKVSTITVLPSSPVHTSPPSNPSGLPIINSPIRSMPVMRSLQVLPTQTFIKPNVQPPIITSSHPFIDQSAEPIQPVAPPTKLTSKHSRRPAPNLVSRKSTDNETLIPVMLRPALVLFEDVDRECDYSSSGSKETAEEIITADKINVVNDTRDSAVPSTSKHSDETTAKPASKASTRDLDDLTSKPSTSKLTPSGSSGKKKTPRQRKKCLSTPRRGRPHVRALDFSTPPKPRGALTSPKVKRATPLRRPPNRKALLFRSPETIREEAEPVDDVRKGAELVGLGEKGEGLLKNVQKEADLVGLKGKGRQQVDNGRKGAKSLKGKKLPDIKGKGKCAEGVTKQLEDEQVKAVDELKVALKPILTEQEETEKAVESISAIREFIAAEADLSTDDREETPDSSTVGEILDPKEMLESSCDGPPLEAPGLVTGTVPPRDSSLAGPVESVDPRGKNSGGAGIDSILGTTEAVPEATSPNQTSETSIVEATPDSVPPEKLPIQNLPSTAPPSQPIVENLPSTVPPSQPIVENLPSTVPPSQPIVENLPSTVPPSQPIVENLPSTAPPSQPIVENLPSTVPPSQPIVENLPSTVPPSQPIVENLPSTAPPSQPIVENLPSTVPPSQPIAENLPSTVPPSQPIVENLPSTVPPSQPIVENLPSTVTPPQPIVENLPSTVPPSQPIAENLPSTVPPPQPIPSNHSTEMVPLAMSSPCVPLVLTSLDNSVEAHIRSYVIGRGVPIATREPSAPLSSAWDRHTGVGSILGAESPVKSTAAWDAALRSLATPSKPARFESDDSNCSCDPKPTAACGKETSRAGKQLGKNPAKASAKTSAKTPAKAAAKPKAANKSARKKTSTTKKRKSATESSPRTKKNIEVMEQRFASTSLDDSDEVSPARRRPTRASLRKKPTKGASPGASGSEEKGASPRTKRQVVVISDEDRHAAAMMTLKVMSLLAVNKCGDDTLVIDEDASDRASKLSSHASSECRLRLSSSDEETSVAVNRPEPEQKEFIEMARIQPLRRAASPCQPRQTKPDKPGADPCLVGWSHVMGVDPELKVTTSTPSKVSNGVDVRDRTPRKRKLQNARGTNRAPSPGLPLTSTVNLKDNEWFTSIVYAGDGPRNRGTEDHSSVSEWSQLVGVEVDDDDEIQVRLCVEPFRNVFSLQSTGENGTKGKAKKRRQESSGEAVPKKKISSQSQSQSQSLDPQELLKRIDLDQFLAAVHGESKT